MKSSTNSSLFIPCGWYSAGKSRIRSTTFTTRTRRSGASRRSHHAAATVSSIGMSPAAAEDDIGLAALVAAGPWQDRCAATAMLDGVVHVEVLQLGLLVDHDEVDVVPAAQAVVGHGKQAVRVRGHVDAGHRAPLGQHHVDQAGALVAKTVVVVAPARRGEQDIERRHGWPPGQSHASWSHFVCWTVMEAETMANAS